MSSNRPNSSKSDNSTDPLTLDPPRPMYTHETSNASSVRSTSPNTSSYPRRGSPSSYEGRKKYSGSPASETTAQSARSPTRNSTPSSRRSYYQQASDESPKQASTYFSNKTEAANSPKLSPTPAPAPTQPQQRSGARLARHISFKQSNNNNNNDDDEERRPAGLNRQRSLVRPERQRAKPSMVRSTSRGTAAQEEMKRLHRRRAQDNQVRNNHNPPGIQINPPPPDPKQEPIMSDRKSMSWWAITAIIATVCFPNCFLSLFLNKKDPIARQAWREKMTLCYIILIFCSAIAFLTFGFHDVLCPEQTQAFDYSQILNGEYEIIYRNDTTVQGQVYDFNKMKTFLAQNDIIMNSDYEGADISTLFDADVHNYCAPYDLGLPVNTHGFCSVDDPYGGVLSNTDASCLPLKTLTNALKPKGVIVFDWSDISAPAPDGSTSKLTVIGDKVYNFTYYMDTQIKFFGDSVHDTILRSLGNDGSLYFYQDWDSRDSLPCIETRYMVGAISTETMGCFASDIIMDVALIVIVGLIGIRFLMALLFSWFISSNLIAPGGRKGILAWRSVEGGNYDPANRRPLGEPTPYQLASYPLPPPPNRAAMSGPGSTGSGGYYGNGSSPTGSFTSLSKLNQTLAGQQSQYHGQSVRKSQFFDSQMYTTILVTCYSEGDVSLRGTLDSLAETTYSSRHKIIFIVCDGMILGTGNAKSTPDIIKSMMELDSSQMDPQACNYIAIADGEKQLNMAKVYAGHYVPLSGKARVPTILVVKVGTPEEADSPKPGNRGKRDSQLILMTFFQRVLFNDRFTALDYEIFWKMTMLMHGVTPDRFELCLMVDADTRVRSDSLSYMVAAMSNDITIMGLCGETRIANKRTSWVTGIQVFEYYISHHYAKAFESVFGGVSCLPGCFSMYRIKAPKNGGWVPILANPDIIMEYNQNVVTTLHAKNLLLLGEDRFLSTLMLRTFPKRQMMFIPQAKCKTIVPDKFSILLSQRRRWINSTIHNLMELTLVSDLCGIACLSMQFAVLIELIGTIVLPAAICLTIYLIIDSIVTRNPQWIALALLGAILGLPAVLIVLTSRKMVYVGWMVVYILALFVWNFVLPVYAYWHFDDFSWGQTRKVEGDSKTNGHDAEGEFDSSQIIMKKWEEWERARLSGRTSMLGSRSSIHRNNSSSNLSSSGEVVVPVPPLPRPVSAVNLPTQLVTPETINNTSSGSGSTPRQSVNGDPRATSAQTFNYPVPSSRYSMSNTPPSPPIPLQNMNGYSSYSSDRPLLSHMEDNRAARSAPPSMSRSSIQFTQNQSNIPPVPSPSLSQNYQRSPSPMIAPQPLHVSGFPAHVSQPVYVSKPAYVSQPLPQHTQSPPPVPPQHTSPPPTNSTSKSEPTNRRSLTRPPVPTFMTSPAQAPPPSMRFSGTPEMSADITSSQIPMGSNTWGGMATNQDTLAPSSSKSDNWSIGQNSDKSFSDDVFDALGGSNK